LLTVNVSPAGKGNVFIQYYSNGVWNDKELASSYPAYYTCFTYNQKLRVTALPATGYKFKRWNANYVPSGFSILQATNEFIHNHDGTSLTAVFEPSGPTTNPTVNAGEDKEAGLNTRVTLQGTVSNPSNFSLTYQWTKKSGGNVANMTGDTTLTLSFTTPNAPTTLVFELKALDSATSQVYDTDEVMVEVIDDTQPTSGLKADAGPDQFAPGSSDPKYRVYLDGSRSRFENGSISSYQWQRISSAPSGISVDLDDSNSPVASFIPNITFPNNTESVDVIFQLTVDDGPGGEQPDTDDVKVTIQKVENTQAIPLANAGPDQAVREKTTVTLDGSASTPKDKISKYLWYPEGNAASPDVIGGMKSTFTAPDITVDHKELMYQLQVTAGGILDSDEVMILVAGDSYASGKQPPTASAQAVPSQGLKPGNQVTLLASGTTDPRVKMFSYRWEIISTDPADMLSKVKGLIPLENNGAINVYNGETDTDMKFTVPLGIKTCTATFQLTATDDAANTGLDTVDVSWTNDPPDADAGFDQTVTEGDAVTLSGSATDDDGALSYKWTQTSGKSVNLSGNDSQTATFIAPVFESANRNLVFKLTVKDHAGQPGTDTVTITVNPKNRPPEARAFPRPKDHVKETAQVTLDGSGSFDPEGGPLRYQWRQLSGPHVLLSDYAAETPTFTAPSVDSDATLTFQLTVTDNLGLKDQATPSVVIENTGNPPTANAGLNQKIYEGQPVILDGSGSTDDGTIEGYKWSKISDADAEPPITLYGKTAKFTAPMIAESDIAEKAYVYELTVTDDQGLKGWDKVTVTVLNDTSDPIADAGPDQTVKEKEPVTLDGSQSKDYGNRIVEYTWELISAVPAFEGQGSFSLDDGETINFEAPQVSEDTTLTIRLTVTDSSGNIGMDTVVVTVNNKSGGGGGCFISTLSH
jgi:hypothetical protein